jgi:hypothetical protein
MSKSSNFTYDDVVSKAQQNNLESKKNEFTVKKIEECPTTHHHILQQLQVIKSFDWVLSRGMRLSKLDEVRTQIAAVCSSNYYCPRDFVL